MTTTVVRHYIDGQWCESTSGSEYPDYNPWTGEVLATVSAGDAEDGKRAIAAAHAARAGWADAPADGCDATAVGPAAELAGAGALVLRGTF